MNPIETLGVPASPIAVLLQAAGASDNPCFAMTCSATDRVGWFFGGVVFAVAGLSAPPATAEAPTAETPGARPFHHETGNAPQAVGFNASIRPILAKHCLGCHGGPRQEAGVSFLRRDVALSRGDSGHAPIVAGDADASPLVDRIAERDGSLRMPPADHGPPLTDRQVALVKAWIDEGAEWEGNWSLVPPRASEPPKPEVASWPRSPIDRYVLARLQREGLRPSQAAQRGEWLRRVSFDLTGLPPTVEEAAAFAADNRPDAFERVVDRLLASPHYGERWASVWMDLARYADTMGYEKDPHRDIWPYRDWVIRAFNADMPYDEFTIKQLAGDLLPDATLADRVATGFHRNTQTNTEGGTDDEEFRTAAVIDRVNTTWRVWMATTFGCAQCHDHPYDPFTQEEYYRFAAFFNTSRDSDVNEDLPKLSTPIDAKDYAKAEAIDRRIEGLRRQVYASVAARDADPGQWRRLRFDKLRSTGSTKLAYVPDASTRGGEGDVVASGTITDNSRFTLEGPAPVGLVTALRIDALPRDLVGALKTPEIGFVLSKLTVELIVPGAPARAVYFAEAYSDEPTPVHDPGGSLRDGNQGWSAYSRLFHPRHAVFLLDEPLVVPEGTRLRLSLKHGRSLEGQGALVIRRGRFSVSSEPAWTELLNDAAHRQRVGKIAELEAERRAINCVAAPVMSERPAEFLRKSYVFERGNWLAKGREVQPGVPGSMPAMVTGGVQRRATRIDIARWIASPANPLTSRTMVNRVWARLFGVGLVETEGDFGGAGEAPVDQALLDYLAVRFSGDHGWRLKALLREIVLSATYRQDARVGKELLDRDPRNRLLARGPRRRLTAEMVRDQALLASGLLSPKRYGPPVMPYQPDSVWASVYSGGTWVTSAGDNRFRRAVYTYWKRTSAYPSLTTFDTPTREVCTVRRIATNTPLQALVTMNDPAYVELAQGLADRMAAEGGVGVANRTAWAYRVATGTRPAEGVVAELEGLYAEALRHYAANPSAGAALADSAEGFASVIVASAILNLDAALTR